MKNCPELSLAELPRLTAAEMAEVDRRVISDFHIDLVQMMENAGRHLADLAVSEFAPQQVLVVAGPGGNGGGGLVAARNLANRGRNVAVTLASDALSPVTAHQLDIVQAMRIDLDLVPGGSDLIIDAILGYSLRGDPRGRAAELIEFCNQARRPVLSLDVPSGLDATTGEERTPCIRADATMTLALPKAGLERAKSVGDLFLADISVPPQTYSALGLTVCDIFHEGPIVRVVRDLM